MIFIVVTKKTWEQKWASQRSDIMYNMNIYAHISRVTPPVRLWQLPVLHKPSNECWRMNYSIDDVQSGEEDDVDTELTKMAKSKVF